MKYSSFPIACFLFIISLSVAAQSTLLLRNSTDYTYNVNIEQGGTTALDTANYTVHNHSIAGWLEDDQKVVTVDRPNMTISNGDTVYLDAVLTHNTDTISLQIRLVKTTSGSTLAYSVEGPDFSHPWHSDSLFHEDTTAFGAKSITVKYKPDNQDTAQSRNILFTLHQNSIYEIDPFDFQDPNVLNVMAYNIQMLPMGITGLPKAALRSDLLPAHFSIWQDVVIFCEVFDNDSRQNHLIPAMKDAGFPYHTSILNEQDNTGPVPTNGGVMIFSRWPIFDSDEIAYSKCGQAAADCAATKGVKYAAIDKMGKHYHLFGTHMDAGSEQDDIEARRSQISEMRQFIDSLGIPDKEPVIMGGDFNLGPNSSGGLYSAFKDTMNPVVPEPIGFYESNFSGDTGSIIDHVWADSRHLLPTQATNNLLTFRSIADTMWELSEFSDHRSVQARFVFPGISSIAPDTTLCLGDSLSMAVQTNYDVSYQWQQNGQPLANANDSIYTIPGATSSDTGNYSCKVSYEGTYGTTNNNIVPYLYPNGPVTFQANLDYDLGQIDDCIVGVQDRSKSKVSILPNPSDGRFFLRIPANLADQEVNWSAYNTEGQLVKQNNFSSSTSYVDMNGVKRGAYLLVIRTDEQAWHKKIILTE